MSRALTILHTNNLHANFEQWTRLAHVLRARRSQLEAAGIPVLVVDAGDHADQSVLESLSSEARLNSELLATLGYHATAVGHKELTCLSLEQLRMRSLESRVPWLLTNVREKKGQPIGGMRESLLLELSDGLRVGLIGITDPLGTAYEDLFGLKNLDTVEVVRETALQLRAEGAQAVVVLAHEVHQRDTERNASAWSGLVDVIVGGHPHHVLHESQLHADVVVVPAGSNGMFLGELQLEWADDGQLIGFSGRLHSLDETVEPDMEQVAVLATGKKQAQEMMNRVLTRLNAPLTHEEVVAQMAECMCNFYRADVGLLFGAVASAGLPAGPVTLGDVYRNCQSFVAVAKLQMQGKQLLGLLQEKDRPELYEKVVKGVGLRPVGIAMGRLQFAGLTWTERAGTICDVQVNGEPLDTERWYTVGSGAHLSDAGLCGHLSLCGTKVLEVNDFYYVKDAYAAYLQHLLPDRAAIAQ